MSDSHTWMETCNIVVETRDATTDRLEKSKVIDHNNFYDRKWLATHCWWAMRNGRKIVTFPVTTGS